MPERILMVFALLVSGFQLDVLYSRWITSKIPTSWSPLEEAAAERDALEDE